MQNNKKIILPLAILFAAALMTFLAGCANEEPLIPVPPAEEALQIFDDPRGKLLFSARPESGDPFDVFLLHLTDGEMERITRTKASDISPAITQDGKKVFFSSDRSVNYDIYSVTLPGGIPEQLTAFGADETEPRVSPDNTSILFQSDAFGDFDIVILDLASAEQTRLTEVDSQETQASWSPDGQQIAFLSDRDGDFEIFLMAKDGSGEAQ